METGIRWDMFQVSSESTDFVTFPALCISESCIKIKIDLNFYFHNLWCLKKFYEGL